MHICSVAGVTFAIIGNAILKIEENTMLDYMESKSARREYEERVEALAPVKDYDAWLTHQAGNWQAPSAGMFISSLASGLASLGNRLKRRPEASPDGLPATPERSAVPGSIKRQAPAKSALFSPPCPSP